MKMRMLPEHWVADRQMITFRCETGAQSHWTFCVTQQTLEALGDDGYYDHAGIFDAFRASIYKVAYHRVVSGNSAEQHHISSEEIKEAFLSRDALPDPR